MFRFFKPPILAQSIFKDVVWQKDPAENVIYLTFDDGPHPEATPWLLDFLNKEALPATFFLTGKNMEEWPELTKDHFNSRFSIGNHTFLHENGWFTPNRQYLGTAIHWEEVYKDITEQSTVNLFRPPFGKIRPGQVKLLKERGYKVIMWSLLSYDFDPALKPRYISARLMRYTRPGSIVVFHETPAAVNLLKEVLPNYIDFCRKKGFQFGKL